MYSWVVQPEPTNSFPPLNLYLWTCFTNTILGNLTIIVNQFFNFIVTIFIFVETFIHNTHLIARKQHYCAFQSRALNLKRDDKVSYHLIKRLCVIWYSIYYVHTLHIMQKYKSLLTCPSILPNIHIYDYLLHALHCTAFHLSVLQFTWPTCTFSVFNHHIKPFRVRDDSTRRHFVKLLFIIIVGKLFTAGYRSTAVALGCEV